MLINNIYGYDHYRCLNSCKKRKSNDNIVSASLHTLGVDVLMQININELKMLVCSGNFLGNGVTGKHNIAYPKHTAICLECRKYPNSPNKKDCSSPYLKPGEKYYSHVAYKFSVR